MEEENYSCAQTEDSPEAKLIKETIEGFLRANSPKSEFVKSYNLPTKHVFWDTSKEDDDMIGVTEEDWDLF